jgi:transcriptional regulator NrdR family protein
MSFTRAFHKKIRAVQVRCSLNLLLQQTGRILAVAGVVAALAVLVQRLLALAVVTSSVLWGFWGIVVGVVLVLWLLRLPSRMQASLLLDERLGLRERFSTTLALAQSDDPFAQAARSESLAAIQRANLRGHFPISLTRSWYYGAGTWLSVIALVFLMPQKDLLGLLKKKQQQEQQAKQIEQAQTQVKQATDAVKAVVEKLDDPALREELKKLEGLAQAGQPQEVKREAIKALGDLSDKLKQMQGNTQISAANMMQQMLQRLRGSIDPFSQQIRTALAKGDFAQAANLLGQLQKDLASGKLSDQQRKDMAQQMQQLAKELQKLAEQKRDLEQELEKLGLDKKMAQMSPPQLKLALQQQGLKPDQIEQLMQKMAASQMAGSRCSGLAQAMAAAGMGSGGLSADELAEAMDQLDALESMYQQTKLLQAGLAAIADGIGGLGECDGIGGQAPWREGWSDGFSSGSGGPGRGFGPRDSDTDGQTGTKSTRTKNAPGEGPVIASWYFKDTQVKGEARRDFTEVVQAGRANAAEAISENQIPRKYEDAVKKYFGELEQRGKGTPAQP